MDGVFAFQRTGAAVLVVFTTGLAVSGALAIANNGVVEIANTSTTASCAFVFTDAGASGATAATTSARTCPPMTSLFERLPQGASYVSAISGAGAGTIVFTPGAPNG